MPSPGARAAVITPFFVDRDAVSNDVYWGARMLRRLGWETRIFALGSASPREQAAHVEELPGFIRSPRDLVLFHFSTGQKRLAEIVARLDCRKVLRSHNVTPAEFFSMWSDELAEASRVGRGDMGEIAAMPWQHVIANSAYTLTEIEPFLAPGTPRSVVAPFHETDDLLALRPAEAARANPPRLINVGRITQSKGHALLLRALRYLVHELATPVVLDIVGKPDPRLMGYFRVLQLMVREYALEGSVQFHADVTPAALSGLYAGASAMVHTSEHEGFCVPLIEAMAFGVPIVALGVTAVPETLGDAGIAWEERDPRRFALSIKRLLESPEDAAQLRERGLQRYRGEFASAVLEQRLGAALEPGGPKTGV